MITYRAAKEVVEEEGFDDLLEETMDRVDEIEGMQGYQVVVYPSFRLTDISLLPRIAPTKRIDSEGAFPDQRVGW